MYKRDRNYKGQAELVYYDTKNTEIQVPTGLLHENPSIKLVQPF